MIRIIRLPAGRNCLEFYDEILKVKFITTFYREPAIIYPINSDKNFDTLQCHFQGFRRGKDFSVGTPLLVSTEGSDSEDDLKIVSFKIRRHNLELVIYAENFPGGASYTAGGLVNVYCYKKHKMKEGEIQKLNELKLKRIKLFHAYQASLNGDVDLMYKKEE